MYITEDNWKLKGLPNKLSELIEVALKDLELVENDKDYCIDMQEYHSFDPETKQCQVCLAGCVLAMELDLPLNFEFNVCKHTDTFVEDKLDILDDIRLGSFRSAIYVSLGRVDSGHAVADRVSGLIRKELKGWFSYRANPRKFKENLKIVVKILKENNL